MERIKINKEENKLEIEVRAFQDVKKQQMLLVWIILFSLCGLAIFSQFFKDYEASTKVFFGVYIAFWLFFEFKVVYAYRWRKLGLERIIVDDEELILIKTIGRRGLTQIFKRDEIKRIDFFKDEKGEFAKSMTTSYWNINKYALAIHLENEKVPFAVDLENKDAKMLLNLLRDRLKE